MIPLSPLTVPETADTSRARGLPLTRSDASVPEPVMQVAKRFEAAFVAEMLRHTGVGKMSEGFNGGAGEAAFANFLTQAYAEKVSQNGAFRLADKIYASMIARSG